MVGGQTEIAQILRMSNRFGVVIAHYVGMFHAVHQWLGAVYEVNAGIAQTTGLEFAWLRFGYHIDVWRFLKYVVMNKKSGRCGIKFIEIVVDA